MPFHLELAQKLLPESLLCSAENLPRSRPPRLISAMASAPTLESSFSGITIHLAQGGLATQKLEGCFSLFSGRKPLRSVQARGALWKLGKLLRGERIGGFKFTSDYLDAVWPKYIDAVAGTTLLSNFQMYGREFFKRRKALDIGVHYYLDGTLAEYFESYANFEVAEIAESTRKRAIEVEQEGYDSAEGIVVMSKLSALALQERYQVPARKIAVVVPGANLPDSAVEALEPTSAQNDDFILGFVGLYPLRKGLDILAKAVQILRGRKLPVRLRVIGKCPPELEQMDGLDYLGIINKKTDLDRFLKATSSVHLGCMVSKAELAGIALLEFLRLGVPVLGTRVGGATDILEGGGSIMVDPQIGAEELAEVIAVYCQDRSNYLALKQAAEARRRWASWTRVAGELDAVLP